MGSTTAALRRRNSLGPIAAVVVMLLILVAACSGSDDVSDSSATGAFSTDDTAGSSPGEGFGGDPNVGGDSAPPMDADTDDGADDGSADRERPGDGDESEGDDSTGVEPVVLANVDLGRSIVYTASLDLQVDDVTDASRAAQQAIAGVGGVVFAQDTTSDPVPRTTLVFKVQPSDFGEAMNRLEGIGTVISQEISADDVTDRVVDLQSRILTAEVSVERLRGLLDSAATVEAIAALEGQLLDRETNLELLRGQLRTLQSAVSLATITVTISEEAPPAAEPELVVVTTAYVGDDEGDRCPGERRLTADEGDSVIACVAIDNAGNADLTDIEVRDLNLDLRREDFTLIDFGEDDVLEPGETVIAWARFDAMPGETPRPSVTAVPVDDQGDAIRQTTTINEEPVDLEVIEDDSLPGFAESIGNGFDGVQRIVGVAIVAVGTLAPFVLLALIPAGLWIWWSRREQEAPIEEPQPAQ